MPRRAYNSAVRWGGGVWLLVMFERGADVEVARLRIPDEDAARIAEKKPYRVIVESKSGGHEHGGYFATLEEAETRAQELRAKHFEYANEERHAAPTVLRR